MQADVSAIIPYFNAEKTIQRAIASIEKQTLKIKEVIIIDDGSENINPLNEILLRNTYSFELKIISLDKNSGASAARNAGINAASCQYIAFLDADDIWLPDKIATQYSTMILSGNVFSGHHYIHDITSTTAKKNSTYIRKIQTSRFIFGNPIATPTVMAKKDQFILFDESLTRMEDYKCWIENSLKNEILFIDSYLSAGFKPPLGSSGLSQSMQLMHNGCLTAIRKLKMENKIPFSYFLFASIFELIKYPLRCLRYNLKNIR